MWTMVIPPIPSHPFVQIKRRQWRFNILIFMKYISGEESVAFVNCKS
jgi:hypothetical protein